jgi:hypothetical protein
VKYAVDLVIIAEDERILQGSIDRLIKIGRCYGIEMNVGRNKVMRISGKPSSVQIVTDQKQLENCLAIIVNDAIYTRKIMCRIELSWHKQHSAASIIFSPANMT